MKVLVPVAVSDANLASHSIPENDYPAYSGSAPYGFSDRVVYAHRIYESLVANNVGNNPDTDATRWVDVGPTNRWSMFDASPSAASQAPGAISFTANLGAVNDIALSGVIGSTVQVSVNGTTVRTVSVPAPVAPLQTSNVVITGLNTAGGTTGITLSGSGVVSVTNVQVGVFRTIGLTQGGGSVSLIDYSGRETDAFGVTSIVRRGYSRRIQVSVDVNVGDIDTVVGYLAKLRASVCYWVTSDTYQALNGLGLAKDWSLSISGPRVSTYSLTIETLTRDDAYLAPGSGAAGDTIDLGVSSTVMLYQRTLTNVAPALPNSPISYTADGGAMLGITNGWSSSVPAQQDVEVVSGGALSFGGQGVTLGGSSVSYGETSTSVGLYPYLWVTTAVVFSPGVGTVIPPSAWNPASLMAQDGDAGSDGNRTAVLDMYQWSASVPTVFPSGVSTYSWVTAQFTAPGSPNGWSLTPGSPVNGATLYIARQVATDRSTSPHLSVTWSTTTAVPIGSTGANGQRVGALEVYKWSQQTPSQGPAGVSTYTWATGAFTAPSEPNGWALAPGLPQQGETLWAASVKVSDNQVTSTSQALWVGAQISAVGMAGGNGQRTAVLEMYRWSSSTPLLNPSGSSIYTWATGQFTAPATANGWTLAPGQPQAGQTLYVARQVYAESGVSPTSTVLWGSPAVSATGLAGLNGQRVGVLEVYRWAPSAPSTYPAGESSYTWATGEFSLPSSPNGWSLTPGAPTPGYTLWAISTVVSDTLSTPASVATWNSTTVYAVGAAGVDGGVGPKGDSGPRGTVQLARGITGNAWSDSEAQAALTANGSGNPIMGDVVTLYNNSANPKYSEARVRTSSAWEPMAAFFNGSLLVDGTVVAQKIDARGLNILDAAGNVVLSAGEGAALDYSKVGGAKPVQWRVSAQGSGVGMNLAPNGEFETEASAGRASGYGTYQVLYTAAGYWAYLRDVGSSGSGYSFGFSCTNAAPAGSANGRFGIVTGAEVIDGAVTGGVHGGWVPGRSYTLKFKARTYFSGSTAQTALAGLNIAPYWNTPAPTSVVTVSNPGLSTAWQTYEFTVTWGATVEGNGRVYLGINNGAGAIPAAAVGTRVVFDSLEIRMVGEAPQVSPGLYQGSTVQQLPSRSYMLAKFSRLSGALTFQQTYDVYGNGAQTSGRGGQTLAADLNATGSDTVVVVWTHDEPLGNRLSNGLADALYRCGASPGVFGSQRFRFRGAYVLIGVGGCGTGNGFEQYRGDIDNDPSAWVDVPFVIQGGQVSVGGSASQPRIDASNISTYMANAAIGGDLLVDGTIHANKLVLSSISSRSKYLSLTSSHPLTGAYPYMSSYSLVAQLAGQAMFVGHVFVQVETPWVAGLQNRNVRVGVTPRLNGSSMAPDGGGDLVEFTRFTRDEGISSTLAKVVLTLPLTLLADVPAGTVPLTLEIFLTCWDESTGQAYPLTSGTLYTRAVGVMVDNRV